MIPTVKILSIQMKVRVMIKMVKFIFSFNENWVKMYTENFYFIFIYFLVCCLIKKSGPLSIYDNKLIIEFNFSH